ncbi:MAG: hypothetical protein ACJA14_002534 [Ilumatobacter sp.]|jgi:hypothetical protein
MFAPPVAQLMFDVPGVPEASPGRIDKNPFVTGLTTVTLNTTDDDGSDDTALTAIRPPAPNVTATAAPNATARPRNEIVSWLSLSYAPSRGAPRFDAGHETPTSRTLSSPHHEFDTNRHDRPVNPSENRNDANTQAPHNALAIARVTRRHVRAGQGHHKRCVRRH